MDVVQRFNAELSSLYDVRLPISKAKMSQITRLSMSGVKMYKHIVQSVERFIHKCRPEYKLPALYVIDSIVRQSRHQFGKQDLYGARFTRNFHSTFQNLFLTCLPDDKPKIVRVLNLWQKNSVFPPEVIQPLLDLANPNTNLDQARYLPLPSITLQDDHQPAVNALNDSGTCDPANTSAFNSTKMLNSAAAAAQAVSSFASNLSKTENGTLVAQLQQLASSLDLLKQEEDQLKKVKQLEMESIAKFADVDYRNVAAAAPVEEVDNGNADTPTEAEPQYPKASSDTISQNLTNKIGSFANMVNNIFVQSDILEQISNLNSDGTPNSEGYPTGLQLSQGTESRQPFLNANTNALEQVAVVNGEHQHLHNVNHAMSNAEPNLYQYGPPVANSYPLINSRPAETNYTQQVMEEAQFAMYQQQPPPPEMPPPFPAEFVPVNQLPQPAPPADYYSTNSSNSTTSARSKRPSPRSNSRDNNHRSSRHSSARHSGKLRNSDDSRDRDYRDRERSRPTRDRYRSNRSRSRSRSRSKSLSRSQSRSMSPDKFETEKERERHHKGLPTTFKEHCLVVGSSTLWIGHVPKYATESDLSDFFGDYGELKSLNLIPSRGCAYVCMVRRLDANNAFNRLKRNNKILGYQVKCAWAPGKALKEKNFQDYWDASAGVAMIPYNELTDDVSLEMLEEGGVIENDTVPEKLMEAFKAMRSAQVSRETQNKEEEMAANSAQVPVNPYPAIVPFSPAAVPNMPMPGANPPPHGLLFPPSAHHQFPFGAPPGLLMPPGAPNAMLPAMVQLAPPHGNWSANSNADSHDASDPGFNGSDHMSNGAPFMPFPSSMMPPSHSQPNNHHSVIPPSQAFYRNDPPNERPHTKFDSQPSNFQDQSHDGEEPFNSNNRRGKPFNNNFNNRNGHNMEFDQNNQFRPMKGRRGGHNMPQLSLPPGMMPMQPADDPPFFDDPFGPSAFEAKFGPNGEMPPDNEGPMPLPPYGMPSNQRHPFEMRFNRPPLLQKPGFIARGGSLRPMHPGSQNSRFWQGPGGGPRRGNPNNFRGGNRGRGSMRNSRWQAPVPGKVHMESTKHDVENQPDSTSNMEFCDTAADVDNPHNGDQRQGANAGPKGQSRQVTADSTASVDKNPQPLTTVIKEPAASEPSAAEVPLS